MSENETPEVEPEDAPKDEMADEESTVPDAAPKVEPTDEPSSVSDIAPMSPVEPKPKKNVKLRVAIGIVAVLAVAAITVGVLFATHVLCIHEWADATCTEPQICSICGRSQGDPLGHEVKDWEIDTPATCTSEGVEKGRCTRCGKMQSQNMDVLPHIEGDWEVQTDWSLDKSGAVKAGERVKKCTACGATLEEESFTPELTASQQGACRAAANLVFMGIGISRDQTILDLEYQGFTEDEAILGVDHTGADWNEEAVESAKSYMTYSGASRSSMMQYLSFGHFTEEQAAYACDKVGL